MIFDVTAKWWTLEIRPERPLRRREQRLLATMLGVELEACVGEDGGLWDPWWHDWPGPSDEVLIQDFVRRLGIPCRVRAAPSGRDCGGVCRGYPDVPCTLGDAGSCDPVFCDADWIRIDPRAT